MKETRKHSHNFNRGRRQLGNRPPDTSQGGLTRRMLIGVGMAAVALGIAEIVIWQAEQNDNTHPYDRWKANTSLPPETVLAIGEDLISSPYLGFADVGHLIRLSQEEPGRISEFYPCAHPPIGIKIQDFSTTSLKEADTLAVLAVNLRGTLKTSQITDKKTRVTTEGVKFVDPDSVGLTVIFDNRIISASTNLKRLAVVKEWSMLLTARTQGKMIAEEVAQEYDIKTPFSIPDMSEFLLINGRASYTIKAIPPLSDHFKHAFTDFDGAGYFYILPTYIQMRRTNALTQKDFQFTRALDVLVKEATLKGLLIEVNGRMTWKQGVTAFSPSWTDISRKYN